MKVKALKRVIRFAFLAVVGIFAIGIAGMGWYIIRKHIFERAQKRVESDLKAAHAVYDGEIQAMVDAFHLLPYSEKESHTLKDVINLDYLRVLEGNALATNTTALVVKARTDAKTASGTRVMRSNEVAMYGEEFVTRATLSIIPTEKAAKTNVTMLHDAMVVEVAEPVIDTNGNVTRVIVGGKLVNKNFALVDKIKKYVFEDEEGTVTIFMNDVRLTTNVPDKKGNRAVGTRVSQEVYENVVGEGTAWKDRAFVVTDWYLTAYEPIFDPAGTIIGILYVGTPEKTYRDLMVQTLLIFATVLLIAVVISLLFAIYVTRDIARPVRKIVDALSHISEGNLDARANVKTDIKEMVFLANSFNTMAEKSKMREKSYLDLISFVSHELKGILAGCIMLAYSIRDGYFGMVNFKQQNALDGITNSLDYLNETVKIFFDLSRLEKGEMKADKKAMNMKKDVIDTAINTFTKPASEKHMEIVENVHEDIEMEGDVELLRIVVNNLIGNAIKYGVKEGMIRVSTTLSDTHVTVEVYNDGTPISEEQKGQLFKRFSRLDNEQKRKVQGTGLGLFITKEIVEKHGGSIWVEPRKAGNAFLFTALFHDTDNKAKAEETNHA